MSAARNRCEWGFVIDAGDYTSDIQDPIEHVVDVGNVYLNTHGKFVVVFALLNDSAFYNTYERNGEFRSNGRHATWAIVRQIHDGKWRHVGRANMPILLDIEWF